MRIETPAARSTDPASSHLAADAITKSGKRMNDADKVLAAVLAWDVFGGAPKTGAEIAKDLQKFYPFEKWDHYKAIKRLCDLKGLKVKHGEKRECRVLGSLCVTWELIGGGSSS